MGIEVLLCVKDSGAQCSKDRSLRCSRTRSALRAAAQGFGVVLLVNKIVSDGE